MPIPMFVWIAVVAAIVLVGGSTAVTMSNPQTASSVLTPVGYGIAVAIVAATMLWRLGRRL